jgi:CheY-like chemotaxis protein
VVDDDDDVRGLARKAIASAGYQVLTAASGPEALLLCERYPGTIHLVVADLLMPHMTGDAFARRLASIRPRAKMLYVTGFAADGVPRDPAARVVTKPFHPSELTAAIRHVLDG